MNSKWIPEPGEMIEVYNGNSSLQREFIKMTSDNNYLCWYEDNTDAQPWSQARPIQYHKELRKAFDEGAIIESSLEDYTDWEESNIPAWDKQFQYRIKDSISIESWNEDKELIKDYWNGGILQQAVGDKWEDVENPQWDIGYVYRIKPKHKTKVFQNKVHLARFLMRKNRPMVQPLLDGYDKVWYKFDDTVNGNPFIMIIDTVMHSRNAVWKHVDGKTEWNIKEKE